ncbi:translation initiation factor IF-2-like isoform X2 [Camelus ferus]|uniref:Translation initiation factor IF-2-like isoform X2 n=1 Tax=Camelus ferus TaxID=419612 RepID=A0A8B8T6W7_CAMFR|nr:translation initiation factor IF-2-like isoform X2 [Camelus ferus]
MSTVRGARGEGAGRVSPGAGRRPSGSAPTPSSRRAEASWRHHPRGERLDHLDADSVPGGGAKARGGGLGDLARPGVRGVGTSVGRRWAVPGAARGARPEPKAQGTRAGPRSSREVARRAPAIPDPTRERASPQLGSGGPPCTVPRRELRPSSRTGALPELRRLRERGVAVAQRGPRRATRLDPHISITVEPNEMRPHTGIAGDTAGTAPDH